SADNMVLLVENLILLFPKYCKNGEPLFQLMAPVIVPPANGKNIEFATSALLFTSLTASTKLFLLVVVRLVNVPMRSANVFSLLPTLIRNEDISTNKSLIKLIAHKLNTRCLCL